MYSSIYFANLEVSVSFDWLCVFMYTSEYYVHKVNILLFLKMANENNSIYFKEMWRLVIPDTNRTCMYVGM